MNPERIAGFGLSLGGEVLLDAAAHDHRLAAVVSDGAARPIDGDKAKPKGQLEGALGWLTMRSVRAVSGMKTSPSLIPMMPKIAPRPVLLVAGGGFPDEIPASRLYRDAGGRTVQLWELPTPATPRACASTRPPTSVGRSASWTARSALDDLRAREGGVLFSSRYAGAQSAHPRGPRRTVLRNARESRRNCRAHRGPAPAREPFPR